MTWRKGNHPHRGYCCALDRSGLSVDRAIAIEDSEAGLAAALAAGLRCLLTPSPWDHGLKQRFSEAIAVFDHLGEAGDAAPQFSGPPCRDGLVTLEYLQTLGPTSG